MKKIIFVILTLSLLLNLSQALACDDKENAESKPAGGQGSVKKGN